MNDLKFTTAGDYMNSTEYTPDAWVIVRFVEDTLNMITYKVFAQWYGGYTQGESWKINSGIVSVEEDGNCYLFKGYSGSVYRCHKNNYRYTGYGYSVLAGILKQAEDHPNIQVDIMDDCDWSKIDYAQ